METGDQDIRELRNFTKLIQENDATTASVGLHWLQQSNFIIISSNVVQAYRKSSNQYSNNWSVKPKVCIGGQHDQEVNTASGMRCDTN